MGLRHTSLGPVDLQLQERRQRQQQDDDVREDVEPRLHVQHWNNVVASLRVCQGPPETGLLRAFEGLWKKRIGVSGSHGVISTSLHSR